VDAKSSGNMLTIRKCKFSLLSPVDINHLEAVVQANIRDSSKRPNYETLKSYTDLDYRKSDLGNN